MVKTEIYFSPPLLLLPLEKGKKHNTYLLQTRMRVMFYDKQ